ncbi:ABC transporter permease subunit [Microbacterium marinilacus]|uniref:ABC transporter permease n=1 Tax=Microbacterium marinilacus TaxID=415209 RepID=A0ABP7BYD9_9MICO|nr:ABC transporter permease subunit [Microbacterium marinilacus]MBY0688078.1 ABC transporter permease subunit [Microbacterium marinilacus]
MTTLTTTPDHTTPRRAASGSTAALTFGHLVRAEAIGLRSLRGTAVTLIVGTAFTVLLTVGVSLMFGFATARPDEPLPADAVPPMSGMVLNGIAVLQTVAVLLGVSIFAKEHSTGALRTHLSVAPRRVAVVGAKAVVVSITVFLWGLLTLLVATAGVVAVYSGFGLDASLDDALRILVLPLLGGALLAALCGVLGLGVAALLRSETWSVTLVLLFLLLLPSVLMSLPFEWAPRIAELLMGPAGAALHTPHDAIDGTVVRDIVLAFAWPAAAVAAGAVAVSRRDA